MIRGHLKIMVLKGLSEKPMTGYSLMNYINEKIGIKPSPGSMYPLLKSLEENKLIKSKEIDSKKIFALTPKGKNTIKELWKHKEEMHEKAVKSLKIMETITGEKTTEHKLMQRMKEGDPFKELNPELSKFRALLIDMLNKGRIEKNKKALKKIFKDAYKELKKISKSK